jgi:hypothetical protein
MLLHQDGSWHEWVEDQSWDLIVTMDDATNDYAMPFVEKEGTRSSFQRVATVIREHGLFSAFYCDRGSHYWLTPETGGGFAEQNALRDDETTDDFREKSPAATMSPAGRVPFRAWSGKLTLRKYDLIELYLARRIRVRTSSRQACQRRVYPMVTELEPTSGKVHSKEDIRDKRGRCGNHSRCNPDLRPEGALVAGKRIRCSSFSSIRSRENVPKDRSYSFR